MSMPSRRAVTLSLDMGEAGAKEMDFEVIYSADPFDDADSSEVEIIKGEIDGNDALWMFVGPYRMALRNDIKDVLDNEEPDFVIPDRLERIAA